MHTLFSIRHRAMAAMIALGFSSPVLYAQASLSQAAGAQTIASTHTEGSIRTPQSRSPGPPIYVEGTFGNDRFDLQTFLSKQFTQRGRGGLLSITSAQGQYNNQSDAFEFVNVTQLNYNLYKGLSPTIGVALSRQFGANITIGLQYILTRKAFFLVIAPSIFVSGSHDVQNVLAVLYQPRADKKWAWYENIQIFDDYVIAQSLNARSFAHMRSGATRSRCTFGVGAVLDWYGQPKNFRSNVGPFVAYSF